MFFAILKPKCKVDAKIIIQTDHDDYYKHISEVIKNVDFLTIQENESADIKLPETEFQKIFKRKGVEYRKIILLF